MGPVRHYRRRRPCPQGRTQPVDPPKSASIACADVDGLAVGLAFRGGLHARRESSFAQLEAGLDVTEQTSAPPTTARATAPELARQRRSTRLRATSASVASPASARD